MRPLTFVICGTVGARPLKHLVSMYSGFANLKCACMAVGDKFRRNGTPWPYALVSPGGALCLRIRRQTIIELRKLESNYPRPKRFVVSTRDAVTALVSVFPYNWVTALNVISRLFLD